MRNETEKYNSISPTRGEERHRNINYANSSNFMLGKFIIISRAKRLFSEEKTSSYEFLFRRQFRFSLRSDFLRSRVLSFPFRDVALVNCPRRGNSAKKVMNDEISVTKYGK